MTDLRSLRRKRWGAWLVLALGLAASIAANALQAQPTVAGYVIAAWPPVCLLLALELMTRVLIGDGKLTKALWVVTVAIALIAFWVSYWHMVETALEHGETTVSAHALPFTVDLLVAVSIGCLVVLSRLMRAVDETAEPVAAVSHETAVNSEPVAGPTEVAWQAWQTLGPDADAAEVVAYVKQMGRPDARTAVYRVQKKLEPVAMNGSKR